MPGKRFAAIATLAALVVAAGVRGGEANDYAELSALIHKAVVAKVPKQFEDNSEWGRTIPNPGNLKRVRNRKWIKVGDHEELPNGVWKRSRVRFDDPAKDIRVSVTELRSLDAKTVRLSLDATVSVHAEQERQRWRRGLHILGFTAEADATVVARLDCDVAVSLSAGKFPPAATVEPKVIGCELSLKEFRLLRVGNLLQGESARELGDELKEFLQRRLTSLEPEIREAANRAIAQTLREGQGKISAATLLKFASQLKPKR
jgi:hypothetical protein